MHIMGRKSWKAEKVVCWYQKGRQPLGFGTEHKGRERREGSLMNCRDLEGRLNQRD